MDLHEEAGKENEQTLANLSPAEEATQATSKDEVEIEIFLQEQKSKNTQYKTKSNLNAWKKLCEFLKESRAIENKPANELDLLLSKFFISVRKQNSTKYEPGTKTRLPPLITPLERPVLGDFEFSKQTFSQTSLHAQLRGHKKLKSLDSYHSASLKRQGEMSAILNCEPGISAQSEENQVSISTATPQNVFTVQQIQPQAICAGAHIDKFESCTFKNNVFRGDQSKIAMLNEN